MPSPGLDVTAWSTVPASNGTSDPSINWQEGQTRASLNDSARATMAAIALRHKLTNGSITTGGSANAQTFTSGIGYTSVPTGLRAVVKIGFANTDTTTLNMDAIGGVTILYPGGGPLVRGSLLLNRYAELVYDGTNWILLNTFSRPGVVDGSDAAAGQIGEYVQTTSGSVPIASAVFANAISQSFTAGDWDISGHAVISPTDWLISQVVLSLSTTSATADTTVPFRYLDVSYRLNATATLRIGPSRFSLASTTTIYLVDYVALTANPGVGTPLIVGTISGRRIR